MKPIPKKPFPPSLVRRYLEPGPVVLVSSAYRGEQNIMTMGWHMILMDEPSLIGCFIWDQNHSHDLVRRSRECVINVPTVDLAATVVAIGNASGRDINKFEKFKLTALEANEVAAPLIAECHANFECRLVDASQIKKYSLFIFECVAAHVARSPKWPKTIHYRGNGDFMIAGPTTSRYRKGFKPQNL
jgi:flavin reductase (DIM6/NTAB) family NADH-FMN oxidoreductase RutF